MKFSCTITFLNFLSQMENSIQFLCQTYANEFWNIWSHSSFSRGNKWTIMLPRNSGDKWLKNRPSLRFWPMIAYQWWRLDWFYPQWLSHIRYEILEMYNVLAASWHRHSIALVVVPTLLLPLPCHVAAWSKMVYYCVEYSLCCDHNTGTGADKWNPPDRNA